MTFILWLVGKNCHFIVTVMNMQEFNCRQDFWKDFSRIASEWTVGILIQVRSSFWPLTFRSKIDFLQNLGVKPHKRIWFYPRVVVKLNPQESKTWSCWFYGSPVGLRFLSWFGIGMVVKIDQQIFTIENLPRICVSLKKLTIVKCGLDFC